MTDVDEADHLASVIAGAWRGDPACLNTLRGWVGTDAPGTPSTVYHVGPEGLLRDPSKRAASKRSDVYLSFAPFGRRDPRWHAMTISDAIDEVCDCPPLAKVFEAAALSHYNRLEMRLLTDQNLGARGQATIRQQLKELAAPGRPVWINWVHATPSWQRDKFDRLTRAWLRQPIDLAEAQWFAPGWRCRDIQWAADDVFVHGQHPAVLRGGPAGRPASGAGALRGARELGGAGQPARADVAGGDSVCRRTRARTAGSLRRLRQTQVAVPCGRRCCCLASSAE